jgi:hypothetical protein
MYGGVAGEAGRPVPLCRFPFLSAVLAPFARSCYLLFFCSPTLQRGAVIVSSSNVSSQSRLSASIEESMNGLAEAIVINMRTLIAG